MTRCKKYESCSAPICPFDADWKKRSYLNGESVCLYMSEYSKPHARELLSSTIDEESFEVVSTAYFDIYNTYGALKRKLDRSSKTPSRFIRSSHAHS